MEISEYANKAKEHRRLILKTLHDAHGSFSGGSLSAIDVLTVLFDGGFIRVNKDVVDSDDRDMFILSKGHCSSALYSILVGKGIMSQELLDTYGREGSVIGIHPKRGSCPGIEASTGSLGHGLALATGSALASRIRKYDSRVFVLMGDGECNEGSVWENAAFATRQNLYNLTVIVDRNRLQGCGYDKDILNYGNMAAKFMAFGFDTIDIDGHDYQQIHDALTKAVQATKKPVAIICNTIKGKGVSFMEDKLEWHYKSPNEEQLQQALEELS